MRGIVLAGGTGSRLDPLTRVTNKHLLPVGGMPMIFHPIGKLIRAGIKEIMIVTGTEHSGDVFRLLGSGATFGGKFTYRIQDRSGGIAQALGLCEDFVDDKPFCVLLGDNIFQDELRQYRVQFDDYLKAIKTWSPAGMIILKEVPDPERYGVAIVAEDGRITAILEKPVPAPSNLAVTGIYFYSGKGVFDLINGLRPSGRGEIEITDLNSALLRLKTLTALPLLGYWTDAGTFESLARANELQRTSE